MVCEQFIDVFYQLNVTVPSPAVKIVIVLVPGAGAGDAAVSPLLESVNAGG
jgi:hypothetical protein